MSGNPVINNFIKIIDIAPCGMNCGICQAFLRKKNKCSGCNKEGLEKLSFCLNCIIKNCENLKKTKSKFCFACEKYPCTRLKQLDKRYRTKYGMSMIENLENIKQNGIRKFVKNENTRWRCSQCGKILCVHRDYCLFCGKKR